MVRIRLPSFIELLPFYGYYLCREGCIVKISIVKVAFEKRRVAQQHGKSRIQGRSLDKPRRSETTANAIRKQTMCSKVLPEQRNPEADAICF
jgi:hypothetical protein